MKATTWGEWWKAIYNNIKHEYSKKDISTIEGLLRVNWNAATYAAKVKFKNADTSSPKCGSCGSGTVKVVCGSCGKTGVYGTWSE